MKNRKNVGGFTLAEMLVVIGLMTFIIATITAIFNSSVETSGRLGANTTLFKDVRMVLDKVSEDFRNADPLNGYQAFVLENGTSNKQSGDIAYADAAETESDDAHTIRAADRVIIRTSTRVADTFQHVEVKYYLESIRDRNNKPIKTLRTKTPIFRLLREIRTRNPENEELIFDQVPKDSKGRELPAIERICENVFSFNIEYMTNRGTFAQLSPSPCPPADPLGDGEGANDSIDSPILIEAIRISLIMTDSIDEFDVKPASRVLNLPFE